MCIRKSEWQTYEEARVLTSIKYETYLDFVRVKCFRDALIRFRLGITESKIHKNRYVSHVADSSCPLRKTVDENKYQFLFHCETYETVGQGKRIKRREENWKFTEIILCEGLASTKQLAWFVFKAFEIRTKLLEYY